MIRKYLPVVFALFMVAIVGCSEDPISADNPMMKADVDGSSKETTSINALKVGGAISVQGAFSDGTSISMVLPGVTEAGDVDLGENSNAVVAYSVASTTTTYVAISGKVTIESIDETSVTGSFEFKGSDGNAEVEIEDGQFAAKFQ